MRKIRSPRLLDSFKYALRGITYSINNEKNMRIHTVAAITILSFSHFFNISKTQYAIVLLTIALVISTEMLNTASEELTDMSSATYNPMARISKDVAAGAVLICAIFAVAIGIIIFWQPDAFLDIYYFFTDKPIILIPVMLFFLISFFYIKLGPIGIKGLFYRMRRKIKLF